MPTNTNIPSTPADGNIKTVLVPEVEYLANPTVTEATAETAIDISCYLTRGGFALTVDQQVTTDERECDRITRQAPGSVNPSLEITGIDNTNSEFAETANALAEALEEGSRWVALRRRGKAFETAIEGDDVVSVTRFTAGVRREVAAEANSVLRSVWTGFVDGFEPVATVVANGGGGGGD